MFFDMPSLISGKAHVVMSTEQGNRVCNVNNTNNVPIY